MFLIVSNVIGDIFYHSQRLLAENYPYLLGFCLRLGGCQRSLSRCHD